MKLRNLMLACRRSRRLCRLDRTCRGRNPTIAVTIITTTAGKQSTQGPISPPPPGRELNFLNSRPSLHLLLHAVRQLLNLLCLLNHIDGKRVLVRLVDVLLQLVARLSSFSVSATSRFCRSRFRLLAS